jgi:hypothetical protein
MFFDSLHSTGRLLSEDMPWLSGPRHCGQFEPLVAAPAAREVAAKPASRHTIIAN